jgi:predicted RNA binding protein YcfA (HicA-like mRNA interferase family)
VRRVKDIEKGVTKTISGAIRSAGGSMAGLKFRMKTLHSLARKIHDKALERGYTMDESAARIGDALRYTGVFSTKDYSKGIRSTLKALMKQGYKVVVDGKTLSQKFTMDELETHWLRGDAYNGVHAILRHPNGTKIEVQFHTPESFKAKMKNHALYEEFRKPSTPLARKKELIYQMVEVADRAPVPSGALSFGERIFRPAEELG